MQRGARNTRRTALRTCAAWFGLWVGAAGCATPTQVPQEDVAVYRRAEAERVEHLRREIARLQADLREAEEALVAAESGLRGTHIRADAVSALAQARIEVDRAAKQAPWRSLEAAEARAKLEEAERQLAAGHIGSAIFFASRASRIATILTGEARRAERNPNTRFVAANRVNLRSGPSTETEVRAVMKRGQPVFVEREEESWVLVRTLAGTVGWVHANLVR